MDINMVMTQVMSQCNFESDCFDDSLYPINTADFDEADEIFPLSMKQIAWDQMNDEKLVSDVQKHIKNFGSLRYTYKNVEGADVIHDNNKILVPASARERITLWYHEILVHPGGARLFETMNNVFTWKGMRDYTKDHCKHCHECQMCKTTGRKKYGLLPEKEGELTRWS